VLAALLCLGLQALPSAAVSPKSGTKIAFRDYMTNQIYVVNPDGTNLTQLTHVPDNVIPFRPSWSPDGSTLVYGHLNLDNFLFRIWTINADGTGDRRLATETRRFNDVWPSFSPDGTHIVFERCFRDGPCAIWIMNADGTHKRAVTPFKKESSDTQASVSPDNRHVAYTALDEGGILAQIHIVGVDGSDNHAVTPPRLEAGAPEWSPDGQLITFMSNLVRNNGLIYTMRPDGSDIVQLTHTPYPLNDLWPIFSPDGTQIAFVTDRQHPHECCRDLMIMRLDGSDQHLVDIDDMRGPTTPSWGVGSGALQSSPEGSLSHDMRPLPDRVTLRACPGDPLVLGLEMVCK